MTNLLGPDGRNVLRALAGSSSLLAFDFDGTLAPLVIDRRRAALRPRTRTLLARVSSRYPCAVISGRARADLERRLAGTGITRLVGNHGLEGAGVGTRATEELRRARRQLQRALRGLDGVEIEDKRLTLSVHYRRAPNRRFALARIQHAVTELPSSLRTIGGHYVVNVLPAGPIDKGTALARVWQGADADVALYVGDDVTDEHVFRLAADRALVGVHIGASRRSQAAFFLRSQSTIDELLEVLLVMRGGVA